MRPSRDEQVSAVHPQHWQVQLTLTLTHRFLAMQEVESYLSRLSAEEPLHQLLLDAMVPLLSPEPQAKHLTHALHLDFCLVWPKRSDIFSAITLTSVEIRPLMELGTLLGKEELMISLDSLPGVSRWGLSWR